MDSLDVLYIIFFWFSGPIWLIMLFLPFWRGTIHIVQSHAVSGIMCVLYTVFFILSFFLNTDTQSSNVSGSLFDLPGFQKLMQNKYTALTVSLHYLLLDLLIGIWIFLNSRKHQIPHLFMIIILPITAAASPIGLSIYLVLRFLLTREYRIFDEHEVKNKTFCFLDENLLENGKINWFFFLTVWVGTIEFWKKVLFLDKLKKKDENLPLESNHSE
eukprot:gene7583-11907_t